jgi:hypothetical protein
MIEFEMSATHSAHETRSENTYGHLRFGGRHSRLPSEKRALAMQIKMISVASQYAIACHSERSESRNRRVHSGRRRRVAAAVAATARVRIEALRLTVGGHTGDNRIVDLVRPAESAISDVAQRPSRARCACIAARSNRAKQPADAHQHWHAAR